MNSKTTLPALLAAALLFWAAATLSAQSRPASFFERLTPEDKVALTLSTDVSALIANKNKVDYQPAKLTTLEGKTYELQVKSRGKFRRKIAEIPPLKLKIKKKVLEAEGLDTLNEIKLVLPCTLDENGNELVLREYLAYRMFERLTPNSARARLVDLTLLNTGAGNKPRYTLKAILLEDEEETAARLGGTMLDFYGMTTDSLETRQAALTVLFQYMIGNTDWNIAEQRNVRFMRTANGEILMIPFDFDFAGFVNAPYATPNADTGLKNIRDRYLMSDKLDSKALESAYRAMQAARQDFNRICRSAFVAPDEAAKLVEYLDSFYDKPGKHEGVSFR
ncbi:MAG: hypothetical protein L6Q97_20870 [Thermoanaerobaculia bacterium]|nr:hypothetical protein [Thermoanaerobaculia bacterium]